MANSNPPSPEPPPTSSPKTPEDAQQKQEGEGIKTEEQDLPNTTGEIKVKEPLSPSPVKMPDQEPKEAPTGAQDAQPSHPVEPAAAEEPTGLVQDQDIPPTPAAAAAHTEPTGLAQDQDIPPTPAAA
eukprot:11791108-Karenia_brevis.AAC.1